VPIRQHKSTNCQPIEIVTFASHLKRSIEY
jgi:hypothetical protein